MTNDHRLHVAVVDRHKVTSDGIVAALNRDTRLHVVFQTERIADLATSGVAFDTCVLDPFGVGALKEIRELMQAVPTVVFTAADHWQPYAAAWACGARAVLGKDVGGVPLANAAWDAVHQPYELKPQLAQALLDGAEQHDMVLGAALTRLLDQVARGRRVQQVLTELDLGTNEYRIEIEQLRNEFVRIFLASSDAGSILCPVRSRGLILTPGIVPPEAAALTARERQILEEYADGYTYEQISETLFISVKTVRNHVLNAMRKLEIRRADGETRFCFAVFISGRHRCPEKLRSRLGLDVS